MSADEDTAAVDGIAAMREKRERNKRTRNQGGAMQPRHPKKPPTGEETPGQQGDAPTGETDQAGDSAGVSASENASGVAGVTAGVPESDAAADAEGEEVIQAASPPAVDKAGGAEGEAASGDAGESAGGKPAAKEKERPAAPSTWRPSRRPGRPKGPDRIPLSVRILAEHDARLTQEVERQQLSPQFIVDQALGDYFAKLDRRSGLKVSASENASGNNGGNAGG